MILYRLLISLAFPVLLVQAVLARAAFGERLGRAPGRGSVWVHGASLGELSSGRGLIAALAAEGPVVVTCNTMTGRALVAGWGMAGVTVGLAPFDLRWCLRRFLGRSGVKALVLIESELWPNRMALMSGHVGMVGARISARAAGRWARFAPGLMRGMLGGVQFLSAQDTGSATRYLALGLDQAALGPKLMLKAGASFTAEAPPFVPVVERAECLLAASTHAGDEGPILAAFAASRAVGQFRHLILAPRHPERGGEVAELVRAAGLSLAQRSEGEVPGPETAVHLADSLGEMGHWYAMAGVTIIGGSFSDRGGHTPFEPVAAGSAVLHGPDVANFSEAFAALDAAGGAGTVAGFAKLEAALLAMTPERQRAVAEAGRRVFAEAGDIGPVLAGLRVIL